MPIPEFSFAALASARVSTAPAIRMCINLPKSEKQLNEIFAFPNLVELVLDVAKGFGEIPDSLHQAANLRLVKIENLDKFKKPTLLPKIFLELAQIEAFELVYCSNLVWGDSSWVGMSNLTRFYVYNSGSVFPNGLLDAPKIQSISLSGCNYPSIPTEIGLSKTIRELYINLDKLKVPLPKQVADIENLEKLRLNGIETPDWIGDCNPKLKHLWLSPKTRSKQITEKIYDYTELELLSLFGAGITELSPKIGQLQQLKTLVLNRNELSSLPDEFANLQELEALDIERNKFTQMPGVIAKLPKLNLKKLEMLFQATHDSELNRFERFLKWVYDMYIHKSYRILFADIWDKKPIPADKLNITQLVKAVKSGIAQLNTHALYYLTQHSKKAYRSLQLGDHLFVAASIGMTKTALKEKLANQQVQLDKEVNEKTTHLLINENSSIISPNDTWLEETKLCFMSESQLMDFLNATQPDYLVQDAQESGDSGMVEQVNSLLLSLDGANIDLAFELLKSGGTPNECKTALFTVYKLAQDNKQRGKAGKLLQQAASEALKNAMLKRIDFVKITNYQDFIRKVAAFEDTELDMPLFALSHYKQQKDERVFSYILNKNIPECTTEFLQAYIKNGELKLSLSYYDVNFVPKEIGDLQGLRKLSVYIWKTKLELSKLFPTGFEKLQELQELELMYNSMLIEQIPPYFLTALTKLPQLRKVEISAIGNSQKAILKQHLPNCEIV